MKFKIFELKVNTDIRGNLVAIDCQKDMDFNVKRIFYIYGNNGRLPRANHANRQSEEILICLNGSCRVFVDDGKVQECILLDTPERALYIANDVWIKLDNFTEDCIILTLASNSYNPNEKIHSYNKFLDIVK